MLRRAAPDLQGRRVLLSAYACGPHDGSEPGVGWQTLLSVARLGANVTLLTRENNVSEIRACLPPQLAGNVTVVGFDLGAVTRSAKKHLPYGTQLYYCLWQRRVRSLVRKLCRATSFDIAHHVTFAVDWAPSALAALPDSTPLVFGPIGGVTRAPRPLWRYLGVRSLASEATRWLVGEAGRRSFGRRMARRAAVIVAQNDDEAAYLDRYARNLSIEPNAVVGPTGSPGRLQTERDNKTVVVAGRLIAWKGWALALEVVERLPENYRMAFYGDGADRRRIIREIEKHGLGGRVVLHGLRPRDEVMEAMSQAHCLLHASLHDSAPGVVAEAITAGTPVVGIGVGGTATMLRLSDAEQVDPSSNDVVGDLVAAITSPSLAPATQTRWLASRLDDLILSWYSTALSNGS
jgi:glycosyltransferase involved in cell wall biosynthesis